MCPLKTDREKGSAILEFIAVILIGQVAILAGTIALSQSMTLKLNQDLAVEAKARELALGKSEAGTLDLCAGPLICISNQVEGHEYRGIGFQ